MKQLVLRVTAFMAVLTLSSCAHQKQINMKQTEEKRKLAIDFVNYMANKR